MRIKKKNSGADKSDRYISPRRIAGLILLAFSILFIIIGIAANADSSTYNPNNMRPGYTFGAIALVLLAFSIKDPKTKTEYATRKEAKQIVKTRREQYKQSLTSNKVYNATSDGIFDVRADDVVIEYLKAGRKIQAVKEIRAQYGYGLAEAKELADQLEADLQYSRTISICVDSIEAVDDTCPSFEIDGMDGHEFEYFCANLLRKDGFSEVSVTKGSGDQGVDILATKGGIKYAIQCKNYASALGNTPVQEVNAGKTFYNCHVGVVMTNSTFTSGAKALAQATGVLLWDRAVLQKLMEDVG